MGLAVRPKDAYTFDQVVSTLRGVMRMINELVTDPEAKRLLQARIPVEGVYGNCDGERAGLAKLLPSLTEGPRHLELGGRKICLIHNRQRLRHEDFEASDILVCGHTHEPKVERREGRLVVNPGECCGWLSGRCTVAVIDTHAMSADVKEVYEQVRS